MLGLIAGGLLSGLGGAASSMSSKPGGFQMVEPKWYQNPGSEGSYKSAWGNIQNQQEALSRGELPSYYQKYRKVASKNLQDNARRLYFGSPGDRGQSAMGNAYNMAAMGGWNPRALKSQLNKVMGDYQNNVNQIEYNLATMDQEQFNRAQDSSQWVASNSGSWQKPDMMQMPAKTNPWLAAAGGLMSGAGSGWMMHDMMKK